MTIGPLAAFLALTLAGNRLPAAEVSRPVISHTPAPVALQGQSIAVKARISAAKEVKSVWLHYSTSRDVAPFKLEMQPTGRNVYFCAIPANLLLRAPEVTYYIEATDRADVTTESPWYTVSIQPPQAGVGGPPAGAKAGSNAAAGATGETEGWWTTPKIVTGGVLLAGGAAALLISQSSGGGGGSSEPANDTAGTYVGAVSSTLEMQGQAPVTSTHGCTLVIAGDGSVSSSDLHTGQPMQGRLTGQTFSLVATISQPDLEGSVTYAGDIANGRINGSVGGTVHQPVGGTNGTCYGTFYGLKQ